MFIELKNVDNDYVSVELTNESNTLIALDFWTKDNKTNCSFDNYITVDWNEDIKMYSVSNFNTNVMFFADVVICDCGLCNLNINVESDTINIEK